MWSLRMASRMCSIFFWWARRASIIVCDSGSTKSCGSRTLAAMATFGRVDTLKLLLRADANPNARGANGVRPLMCAARYGQVAAVKALLKAGAGVNRADNEGSTALLVAVRYNEQAVVRATTSS